MVLADFDRAFFDLQSEGDVYADNPTHYMYGQTPFNDPAAGRYPPVRTDNQNLNTSSIDRD